MIAQPLVQEVSSSPCDTGSDPKVLAEEFGEWWDGTLVTEGWNDKVSEGSPWRPTIEALEKRALETRRWLRELGRAQAGKGQDADIVVATHGGFLHFLTQDWQGYELSRGTGWMNTEWRSYEFVHDGTGKDEDEEASIIETEGSWKRRRGSEVPLTETERRELRAVLIEGVQKQLDAMEVANNGNGV